MQNILLVVLLCLGAVISQKALKMKNHLRAIDTNIPAKGLQAGFLDKIIEGHANVAYGTDDAVVGELHLVQPKIKSTVAPTEANLVQHLMAMELANYLHHVLELLSPATALDPAIFNAMSQLLQMMLLVNLVRRQVVTELVN